MKKKTKERKWDMERFDLLVAGGGFAGTAAAIAAARQGARVLLIEKTNCLGGAACSSLVNPFMPFWTSLPGEEKARSLCNGIFAEVLAGLREMNALGENGMTFDEEALKLLLNRMALKAGVRLLFHAQIAQVQAENGVIRSVLCATPGGPVTLEAETFIDATGDGTLSMLAGCQFHLGREGDHLCQPMTLCFRMAGVDRSKMPPNPEIDRLYNEAKARGEITNPREDVLVFDTTSPSVLHFNTTRIVKRNPVDPFDLSKAEEEAREQVFEMFRFLRKYVPGCEKSVLLSTATHIGIRESRMIEGEYTLTADDLLACRKFDDGIAACNYDIDIHNPEGSGTTHYYFKPYTYYTIPYRCLVPKGSANLLVAGRCISSTHEAQASYRVIPYVATLGEAAGVAAAVANKNGTTVKDAPVDEIQSTLRAEGAFIEKELDVEIPEENA